MKKTFRAKIVRDGSACYIPVPFDPWLPSGQAGDQAGAAKQYT